LKNTPLDIARKKEEKWERVEFFTQSFLLLGLLKMNMIGTNVFNFWSIRVYNHQAFTYKYVHVGGTMHFDRSSLFFG
jgi:hypothetical protein